MVNPIAVGLTCSYTCDNTRCCPRSLRLRMCCCIKADDKEEQINDMLEKAKKSSRKKDELKNQSGGSVGNKM